MRVFIRSRVIKSTRCVQCVRLLSALALSICLIFNYKLLSGVDEQETGTVNSSVYSLAKGNGREESYRMRTHSKVQIQRKRLREEQPVIVDTNSRAVVQKFEASLNTLSTLALRYYVYSDERILQREVRDDLKYERGDTLNHPKMPFIREAQAEVLILDTLEKHPLRTLNPEEADLFIIPTSTSAILMKRTPTDAVRIYAEAFQALLETSTFQATGGNQHVLVSTALWGFSHRSVQEKTIAGFGLPQHYGALRNVTIANDMDYAGCRELSRTDKRIDFIDHFNGKGGLGKVTRSDFSLGLMPSADVPFYQASFEKFMNSTNFLFYHVRPREFIRNSTPFRRAPLRQEVIDGLPPSSIGSDIPYDEWKREFPSSRFCLAIRGDTPHSHALLRAVKVGCIPVVVCDSYPLYAPTFKSSVNMRDYAIFIPEKAFLEDPLRELRKLADLTETEIREKLEALAFAQRVVLPDHPESLFVPAFLRESLLAQREAVDP
jgi:hypothetical protein